MLIVPRSDVVEIESFVGGIEISRFDSTWFPRQLDKIFNKPVM